MRSSDINYPETTDKAEMSEVTDGVRCTSVYSLIRVFMVDQAGRWLDKAISIVDKMENELDFERSQQKWSQRAGR